MKISSKLLPVIAAILMVMAATRVALAQSLQLEAQAVQTKPVLMTNPPLVGTFFLLSKVPSPPYPFDPFQGLLPVYAYDGVFFVDDTGLDAETRQFLQSGGGMMLMSGPSPPPGGGGSGGGGGGIVYCTGPTNFTVSYQFSTNDLWLGLALGVSNSIDFIIHTPDTNALYDLFATTNLSPCVPGLNQTNWTWLLRATNTPLTFTWGATNSCEAWFQLGTMQDDDSDGLTTAYEHLVSKTDPNNSDSDYDGRSDAQELADGTDPWSAANVVSARLAYFPLADASFLGSVGQIPLVKTNLASVEAWLTKGLQVSSTSAARLKYRDVETGGSANLNLRNGAVRFWFKSSWDTGTGTSNQARLIEVGTKGAGTTNGWWALYFSKTNGTEISFAAETNNAGVTYLTGAVSWAKCDWNQLVLNYTPSNSALYLNSSLVSTGLGVTLWPGATVRSNGFTLGSDASGTNQARGIFEDLETFNYPLSTNEIVGNFQTNRPPNAIADLKMWLKADAGIETNNAFARVSAWRDQTCNGNNATQTTGGYQPYFATNAANGLPVVRFQGSHFVSLPTCLTNEGDAFIVLKANSGSRGLWVIGGSAGKYPDTDGLVYEDFGRGSRVRVGNPAFSLTNFHLYNVSSRLNEWVVRWNGIEKYEMVTNAILFSTGARLGLSGDYFNGDVAELIFFSRVLSSGERNTVSRYLSLKYAVVTNTPAPPSNVLAAAVSKSQISLWWQGIVSEGSVNYVVERKTGSSGLYSNVARVANTWSYVDTNLSANTEYFYRIKSTNYAAESGYSNETNSTTLNSGTNFPGDLRLWLKSDEGAPVNNDNSLEMWFDLSGNRNHGRRNDHYPVLTNALGLRPVVRFSFSRSWFEQRGETFSGFGEGEVFAVLKVNTNAPAGDHGLWYFSDPSASASSYPKQNGHVFDDFGSASAHDLGTNWNILKYHLFNVSSTTNLWTARVNGGVITNDSNTVRFPASGPLLGVGANNAFFGDIAELLLYRRPVNFAERTAIEAYLKTKHGIQ